MEQTKGNTLYLPIKQTYFDQIIAGTKKEEYREVKYGITASRYLLKDDDGKFVLNSEVTYPDEEYFIDDYNNGKFPFLPKTIKFLDLAVGYAKERDTATVEVESITFEAGRVTGQGERIKGHGEKRFAFWLAVFHLGKVVRLHRKNNNGHL